MGRGVGLLGMLFLPLLASADSSLSAPSGLQRAVVFTEYSPLSRNEELVRRLMSPLNAARLRQEMTRSQQQLREQSIDLAHETFILYVPSQTPPRGYGVLVFVPPWQDARVPQGWASVLDRHGMIFVSAANSGNEANILNRREPLALLAAANIMRRYPVDSERVYIAGFSGGSRVALRIALGYPDVFHGVLLNSGSDPISGVQAPLPPADLFERFQLSTRLVYLTGQQDTINLTQDGGSRLSMRDWCVFNVEAQEVAWMGHEAADSGAFNRALEALVRHTEPDADKLAHCRARIEKELTAELRQVEEVLADGKPRDALKLLERIDARYGGLAAPRSVALAEQIEGTGLELLDLPAVKRAGAQKVQ